MITHDIKIVNKRKTGPQAELRVSILGSTNLLIVLSLNRKLYKNKLYFGLDSKTNNGTSWGVNDAPVDMVMSLNGTAELTFGDFEQINALRYEAQQKLEKYVMEKNNV